jgi:hypothetical protein
MCRGQSRALRNPDRTSDHAVPKLRQAKGLLAHPSQSDGKPTSTRSGLARRLPKHNNQQPCGITPGVAAAPVAFAGGIMAGLARSIVMLSLHAAEFGVGITVIAGSMLELPRSATGD